MIRTALILVVFSAIPHSLRHVRPYQASDSRIVARATEKVFKDRLKDSQNF